MQKIKDSSMVWIAAAVVAAVIASLVIANHADRPALASAGVSGSSTAFPTTTNVTPGQHVDSGTILFTNTAGSSTDQTEQDVVNDFNNGNGILSHPDGLLIGYQASPLKKSDPDDDGGCDSLGPPPDDSDGSDQATSSCSYQLDLSDQLFIHPTTDQAGIFGGATIYSDNSFAANPSEDPDCDPDGVRCPSKQTGTYNEEYDYTWEPSAPSSPPSGYAPCNGQGNTNRGQWCPSGTDGMTYDGGGTWEDTTCTVPDENGGYVAGCPAPASYLGEPWDPDSSEGYWQTNNHSITINADHLAVYLPGKSASFTLPAFTAPTTAGSYTETLTLYKGSTNLGSYTFVLNVGNNGAIDINADRAANFVMRYAGTNTDPGYSGTDVTSKTFDDAPLGQYTVNDRRVPTIFPYGFEASQSTTTGLVNPPTMLARIIRSVEANGPISCTVDDGWTCQLSNPGGTISYKLSSVSCTVNVSATINSGGHYAGVPFSISASPSTDNTPYSDTTTSGTVSHTMVNDTQSAALTTFNFTTDSLPQTITVNGNTADFTAYTITPYNSDGSPSGSALTQPYNGGGLSCPKNGSLSFVADYQTRAIIDVHH